MKSPNPNITPKSRTVAPAASFVDPPGPSGLRCDFAGEREVRLPVVVGDGWEDEKPLWLRGLAGRDKTDYLLEMAVSAVVVRFERGRECVAGIGGILRGGLSGNISYSLQIKVRRWIPYNRRSSRPFWHKWWYGTN